MALTALIVAIVSALISAGALLHSIWSFRRTGWDLKVSAWWDGIDKQVHVRIINVGRQACVISEIEYHITSLAPEPKPGLGLGLGLGDPEQVFRDHEAVSKPIAPSASIEVTKALNPLPDEFAFEVGVRTGDRAYMSEKYKARYYSQYESYLKAHQKSTYDNSFGDWPRDLFCAR